MQQNNTNAFLVEKKIGPLMASYAIPCIISLLVAALYNVVDQIFIANATYLGSFGNAANTVVFPLTVVALAIAVMVGDGCCAFVSISLGAGEKENAHRSIGNSILLVVVTSVVLMAIYLIFQDPLLSLFGGRVNDETFRLSKEYFTYITYGIPFYMFWQAMNPIIRSDGSPRFAMVSTLVGAVLNIILDPIMIFTFHWGMRGAAIATVIGQVVTALLAWWYLVHMKAVQLKKSSFRLSLHLIGKVLPLGMCSFLSQISLVAAMAAINNMIRKYGAADPVFSQTQYAQIPMAVIGIVMKFFQIVISIVVGMAAGCIPIVGYNIGAGRKDRTKSLFSLLLVSEAIVGLVALVIVECFPRGLIGIFGAANESAAYTEFAIKSFRIYLCMMVLACVNKACFIFLQSLGKAWTSTFLSLVREVVFGVGFALLLPRFFGLDGVLYSMPVSDILTFAVSLVVIVQTYKELGEKPEQKTEMEDVFVSGRTFARDDIVIVIGRSFGAGGRSVGKGIAKAFGIPYYDREILASMSQQEGFDLNYLESIDEKASHGEAEAIHALQTQGNVIRKLAEKPCVIVGRRADQVLKSRGDVLSVFVSAPLKERVERVAKRDHLTLEEGRKKVLKVDKERAAFYNSLSNEMWGEPASYDLSLDTSTFGLEGSVRIITSLVK